MIHNKRNSLRKKNRREGKFILRSGIKKIEMKKISQTRIGFGSGEAGIEKGEIYVHVIGIKREVGIAIIIGF